MGRPLGTPQAASRKGDPRIRVNVITSRTVKFLVTLLLRRSWACLATCSQFVSKGPWMGFLSVLEMTLEVPLRLPWR